MSVLKTLYNWWMKFAKVLGRIQSVIILFFIYFVGVGIIWLVSFIFRKDFLDKSLNDRVSFWQARHVDVANLENSKRQF